MDMRMMNAAFPVTGQPIRVVMIDGEPWFAVADVCKILGHGSPSKAIRVLHKSEVRRVNTRTITLTSRQGNHVSAGGNTHQRGNPELNVISESGLYRLIMRSDMPAARPFQDWVTRELLPAIRRGDADLGAQRERMAETFAEAMELGEPTVSTVLVDDQGFEIRTDGSVHCLHGPMEPVLPTPYPETGPPFGLHFSCREIERVGIRGSIAHRPCRRLHFVDIVRQLRRTADQPAAPVATVGLVLTMGSAQVRGNAEHLAELLHRLGMTGDVNGRMPD
ncbi:BRO-N domain-containing protein [Streptacidiphilus fuscans]|uniref:Bro-N domain-containing protein n=1 Tax=Streptacidiphilus fuscans TaxID=2789292 RepID=A0A931B3Y6_9ACTN|nr:Bro-N domain-containing protein [Streptacidiphilus fuscans]MBF9068232.1 Bro-N domain-containing protein [Streptacidiphilus fuscans]